MKTPNLSSLIGQAGLLVGFGYCDQPENHELYFDFYVYRLPSAHWVLCTSGGQKPFDVEAARASLGQLMAGYRIAETAKLMIDRRITFDIIGSWLIDHFTKTAPDIKFEWVDASVIRGDGEIPNDRRP